MCVVANRMFLSIILKSVFLFKHTESRVYCQDTQALPWNPLGPSCPVTCANVITAVQKLRIADYNNIFYMADMENSNESLQLTSFESLMMLTNSTISDDKLPSSKPVNTSHLFARKNVRLITTVLKKIKPKLCNIDGKKVECARRSDITFDFIGDLTRVLNRITEDKYSFTTDMTNRIVKQALGDTLNLRFGVVDVHKLLEHIKSAVFLQEQHHGVNTGHVTLKSTHCLTIYVSGCFCNSGYVEDSGQCVRPENCYPHTKYKNYLDRITIL